MNNVMKNVWSKIESEVGVCVLYREGAVREVLGHTMYQLTLVTLCAPEKVEEFASKQFKYEKVNNKHSFTVENVRVEIICVESDGNFEETRRRIFNRNLRCETIGITFDGRYNKNVDAYKDIEERVLHLSKPEVKTNEQFIQRILNYILTHGFTVGDDVINAFKKNNAFDVKHNLVIYCDSLAKSIMGEKCRWEYVAEAVRFVGAVLFPDSKIVNYTKGLTVPADDKTFIRNYLYALFVMLDMNSAELTKVLANEPTYQYFDSISSNIDACLKEYKEYSEIKRKYGDEFLELLIDVQEVLASFEGIPYERVSDATFDLGVLFINDSAFWCTKDELLAEPEIEVEVAEESDDSTVDLTMASFNSLAGDKYNESEYETPEPSEDKVYIDDEPTQEKANTGINLNAMDSYEKSEEEDAESVANPTNNTPVSASADSAVMNRQRGHESRVLENGGH